MAQAKNSFLLLALLLFFRLSPVQAEEPINLSYSAISPTNAGIWMAQENGAFKRYGLNVHLVYIPSASTNVQALIGGSLEAAHAGSSAVIAAAAAGAPISGSRTRPESSRRPGTISATSARRSSGSSWPIPRAWPTSSSSASGPSGYWESI